MINSNFQGIEIPIIFKNTGIETDKFEFVGEDSSPMFTFEK